MLTKCHVTRIESGKVLKCLQKYILRIAKKQRHFSNYVSKFYQNVTLLESNREKC